MALSLAFSFGYPPLDDHLQLWIIGNARSFGGVGEHAMDILTGDAPRRPGFDSVFHATNWLFWNGPFLVTMLSAHAASLLAYALLTCRRRNAGEDRCCKACGYSLGGLTAPICPECGRESLPAS